MTCVHRSPSSAATSMRRAASSAACAAALLTALPSRVPLLAQAPPVPPTTPGIPASPPAGTAGKLSPYRAPQIALVQPPGNSPGSIGTVPLDRPVVVFRFAAGEPDDPLDLGSFAVAVDGIARTTLFQVTATDAWGPLADAAAIQRGQLAAGPHRVTARICSSRGACATSDLQVIAAPLPGFAAPAPAVATPVIDSLPQTTKQRVLRSLWGITRKLLTP